MMADHPAWVVAMWVYVAILPLTWLALRFVTAPYGRHRRAGWGPTIPTRWAWVIWESPSVLAFVAFFLSGERWDRVVPLVMLALWLSHYLHRTFVYPFRIRTSPDHRTPLLILALGASYNLLNSYTNALWLSKVGPVWGTSWLLDPRFLLGTLLFVAGYAVNRDADARLRRLRSPGETGYRIPTGGLFRWVTCPNYLGEIVLWLGWAVLTWSPPGFLFALYTAANLVPRARANHRWYRRTFPDYPSERRILVPGLY